MFAEKDQFLDTSTAFLFGESVNSLLCKSTIDAKDFLGVFTLAQEGVSKKIRQGKFRMFSRYPNFENAPKAIFTFMESYMDEALALRQLLENIERGILQSHEGPRRVVFPHELAQQLDHKLELRDQLLSVFTAGHESTAIVTSHVLFLLSRHPAVWRRLRKEVVLLDGREPTFEQLKSMNYLRWVINESEISYSIESASGMIRMLTTLLALRLFPLVPTNARQALKDSILPSGGGPASTSPVFVPKGTLVTTNSYVMHRSKHLYGEAAENVQPERWEAQRQGWHYLPFGGGPRICPGQQLALTEISYTTVRLMQRYERIESRDNQEWKEMLKITMYNRNRVKRALFSMKAGS